MDEKTDALFNEFVRHDVALDAADSCHGRCLTVHRWRRHFHPPRPDWSPTPAPTTRSPPAAAAVAGRRLRRLGATSSGRRRRSRRSSDSVDSPTFRRPSPHDSIEEEDVFVPATADDVQPTSEERRRHVLDNNTNHTATATTGLLSVYDGRRITAIPTICVREEIETDT